MSDLDKLVQHRDAILLAEVGAWLHDHRKCSDEHLRAYSANAPSGSQVLPKSEVLNHFSFLNSVYLSLLGDMIDFFNLLDWRDKENRQNHLLTRYLVRCHHTAHFDKQDPDNGQQNYPGMYLSSPFGFERTQIPVNLTNRLWTDIPWSKIKHSPLTLTEHKAFAQKLITLFSEVGADTRRPINEVTLWNWGHTIGTLYRATLAGALLGYQPNDQRDLCWRLLSVRFDGLSFIMQSSRLPDLLSRKELLYKARGEVRYLLEEQFVIGSEIYQDENVIVFVVPGCEKGNCQLDLLSLQDNNGQTLCDLIHQRVASKLEREIVPDIQIDQTPWWGQDPHWRGNDELPPISTHLLIPSSYANPLWVADQWSHLSHDTEFCIVCNLRPQGPSQKAKDRKVCDTCETRRTDRSQMWTEKFQTTIWSDEIADINGRLALVVGQFYLDRWLDGTLVRTLVVKDPANVTNKTADEVAKNPSFARLLRVWETSRRFWQDVLPTDEDADIASSSVAQQIGTAGPRLEIKGQLKSHRQGDALGLYHAYDLVLSGNVKLSVVWDPQNKRFITADNLAYTTQLLGKDVKTAIAGTLTIEEPVGYGSQNKPCGEIIIQDVQEIPNSNYTPAIPILAEPRTFMALVPADKALAVVEAIKQKYEREMGKVRNRMPLHLGVVYFHRRTPLRAALDAGRRMLKMTGGQVDRWQVGRIEDKQQAGAPDYLQDAHFAQWREIALERNGGHRATWRVPLRMGDSSTLDHWYPYVFVTQDKNGNVPAGRDRIFEAPNPWEDGEKMWLVHAADLVEGDAVYFTPATFDFEWLDTTGRRFEIAYQENGQRRGRLTRPYLLDELQTLDEIWHTLSYHLTTTQIYALRDLVERKREGWKPTQADMKTPQRNDQGPGIEPGGMYWQFCHDAITNAGWQQGVDGEQKERQGKMPWEVNSQEDKDSWLERWADYAVRGWLNDVVELRLQVVKEESETAKKEVTS